MVGGQPTFTLERPKSTDTTKPRFVSAQILPGRGMTTYQIRAYVPGKGEIDLMEAPPLADAPKLMNGGPEDLIGNKSFNVGGAILLPYANRIRGKLSADGATIETPIMGKPVTLIANWKGKNPEAVKNAMHGLILDAKMDKVTTDTKPAESSVTGTFHAGDFQGHWLSKTDVDTKITLKDDAFIMTVTAKNVGTEPLPIGIGWHPYFVLPSGDRTQAKLHLPAKQRALVTNYDDVFPTGKIEKVAGTPYDFTAAGGAALDKLFLDDSFVDLQKTPGRQHSNRNPRPGRQVRFARNRPIERDHRNPGLRALGQEICSSRAPIQLGRSLQQSVGRQENRNGSSKTRRVGNLLGKGGIHHRKLEVGRTPSSARDPQVALPRSWSTVPRTLRNPSPDQIDLRAFQRRRIQRHPERLPAPPFDKMHNQTPPRISRNNRPRQSPALHQICISHHAEIAARHRTPLAMARPALLQQQRCNLAAITNGCQQQERNHLQTKNT